MSKEPEPAPRPRWHRHLAVGLVFVLVSWIGEGLLHVLFTAERSLSMVLWPADPHELWMRALVAMVILGFTAQVVRDVRQLETLRSESARLNEELEVALTHVLAGFIPVCAGCKSIRGENDAWQSMEAYLHDRTEAEFTHGLCPSCRTRIYPDIPRAAPRGRGAMNDEH